MAKDPAPGALDFRFGGAATLHQASDNALRGLLSRTSASNHYEIVASVWCAALILENFRASTSIF